MKKNTESTNTVVLKTDIKGNYLDNENLKQGQIASYSWDTFFLSQKNSYFDKLFDTVIDAKWLSSDDPYATQIRQLMARRKPVWRVLHRVTNVVEVGASAAVSPSEQEESN